jgi:hypothetical protein
MRSSGGSSGSCCNISLPAASTRTSDGRPPQESGESKPPPRRIRGAAVSSAATSAAAWPSRSASGRARLERQRRLNRRWHQAAAGTLLKPAAPSTHSRGSGIVSGNVDGSMAVALSIRPRSPRAAAAAQSAVAPGRRGNPLESSRPLDAFEGQRYRQRYRQRQRRRQHGCRAQHQARARLKRQRRLNRRWHQAAAGTLLNLAASATRSRRR